METQKTLLIGFLGFFQGLIDYSRPIFSIIISILTVVFLFLKIKNEHHTKKKNEREEKNI